MPTEQYAISTFKSRIGSLFMLEVDTWVPNALLKSAILRLPYEAEDVVAKSRSRNKDFDLSLQLQRWIPVLWLTSFYLWWHCHLWLDVLCCDDKASSPIWRCSNVGSESTRSFRRMGWLSIWFHYCFQQFIVVIPVIANHVHLRDLRPGAVASIL